MKKSLILGFFGIGTLGLSVGAMVTTSAEHFQMFAQNESYQIVLNAENGIKGVNQTTNGTYETTTELGNTITLGYTNARTSSENHIYLENGELTNLSAISGFQNLQVVFNGQLNLKVATDEGAWLKDVTLTSGAIALEGETQAYNYFKIYGNAEITSLLVNYSCERATFNNYIVERQRIEAEAQPLRAASVKGLDATGIPDDIRNGDYVSGQTFVDAGDGGSVTYTVYAKEKTTTNLAVAYHTGSQGASIKVTTNGVEQSKTIKYVTGWAGNCGWQGEGIGYTASTHLLFPVTLEAGVNTVVVTSNNSGQSRWLNFDYVMFVNRNLADGTRIQFEDRVLNTQAGTGYYRTARTASSIDGTGFTIDGDVRAFPSYAITVPETGKYTVQIAYITDNSTKVYGIGFDQETNTLLKPTFAGGKGWIDSNYQAYTSKNTFDVELTKGDLELYLKFEGQYIDFDWIRIFKAETYTVGSKIEAEDVVHSVANVVKNKAFNSIISGYLVEFENSENGYMEFTVNVPTAGTYTLQLCGYSGGDPVTANLVLNGAEETLDFTQFKSGWTAEVREVNIGEFNVDLLEGDNTFRITKGESWIDFDWFKIVA